MKRHNLQGVSFSRIALVDKGASFDESTGDGAHVLLFKRAKPADEENPMTITLADITKALAGLSAEDKEALKKALGAAPAPEDILKGASPEVRALVEKAQAAAKQASDESAANKAAIKKLQDDARAVSLRKRVDVYASLSGDKEVLSHILGMVEDGMGEEQAKKFEETLKGWNTQLEKGGVLGAPAGSRGTTETATPGSAVAEFQKRVDEIITKSEGKTDRVAAIEQAAAAHGELYERYSKEVSGRA